MTEIADAKAKKDKAKRGPKPKGDINKNVIKYDQGPTAENILRRLAREYQTELLDAIEPELFNVDAEKAIATAKMLAKVRAKVNGSNQHRVRDKKNKERTQFDGPSPDEMHLAGEQYQRSPIPLITAI